ncbi:hypothetical protein DERP_011879 [Dermatophagoides pteronyssinus]|uniref:Uncharacterized protein n=1 Tax=Dermatophagoides pteronyssinus TaxID=6956 RepID=A0ABQ8J2H4_DERPT|nr:hypothetical protein DERP_011879 [Dermatophagoides pteronyssinus]
MVSINNKLSIMISMMIIMTIIFDGSNPFGILLIMADKHENGTFIQNNSSVNNESKRQTKEIYNPTTTIEQNESNPMTKQDGGTNISSGPYFKNLGFDLGYEPGIYTNGNNIFDDIKYWFNGPFRRWLRANNVVFAVICIGILSIMADNYGNGTFIQNNFSVNNESERQTVEMYNLTTTTIEQTESNLMIKQDGDTNISSGPYFKNLGFDYEHGRPDGEGGNIFDKIKNWYNGTFRPWFQNNKVLFFGICIDDDTNIGTRLGFDYIHGRPDGPSGGNVLDDIKYGLDGTKDKIKEWFNGAKNKTKDWYNGTFRPWFQNNKVLFFGICIGILLIMADKHENGTFIQNNSSVNNESERQTKEIYNPTTTIEQTESNAMIKQDDGTNISSGSYFKNLGFDYEHGRPDDPSGGGGNIFDEIKNWFNGPFRKWLKNNNVVFAVICIGVILLLFCLSLLFHLTCCRLF